MSLAYCCGEPEIVLLCVSSCMRLLESDAGGLVVGSGTAALPPALASLFPFSVLAAGFVPLRI